MSLYSHSTNYNNKVNEMVNLENSWKDFDFPITESEYQKYIDELCDSLNEEIDMDEGFGGLLRPVYICLLYSGSTFSKVTSKFVKDQDYWHAAIGFGPSLSRLYSFNMNAAGSTNKFRGGLSFESLEMYKKANPESKIQVSCIFLDAKKYKRLKNVLYYYIENKEKTKYDVKNLVYSLFRHSTKDGLKMNLVCSTFVDTILRSININLTGQKTANLTKPDDLKAKNEKQYNMFEGVITDYNAKKVAIITEKLANKLNSDYFAK